MADNLNVTPGTGATVAADDDGTALHQQVKVEFGANGVITAVDASNPLPVVQTGTPALPTGAATSAKQDTGNTSVGNIDTNAGAIADAASATGSISAKLRFIAQTGIPITGTVTVGSHAVTNAGTFAVQATEADGANTTLGAKADAKSTATDTTAITIMSVLKQISASVQAPPSQAVTNTGTFAVQATLAAETTKVIGTVNVAASQTIAVTNTGTFAVQADTELPAAAALADDTANPTTTSVGAHMMVYDRSDSNWDRLTMVGATTNVSAVDSGIVASGLLAQFDDVAPTAITENQFGNLRMSANRNAYTTIRDAAGNERGVNVNASNQMSVSVDNTVTVGSHAVTNAGTFAVQATVAAAATNIAKAEDVASADADVGVPAMAIRKAAPANSSGTDGDYEMLQMSAGRLWASATIDTALPAGAALIGKAGIDQTTPGTTNNVSVSGSTGAGTSVVVKDDPTFGDGVTSGVLSAHSRVYNGASYDRARGDTTGADVHVIPKTSGGWTTFHLASAGSTNATNLKASAGQVGGWFIYNSNATARKVVFHNTAGTPTAGASVYFAIVIPPLSGANVEFTNGIPFATGIAITTVTGLADSDNTAVAANDLIINIFYK